MPSSLTALYYHVVFSTKHHMPVITPVWRDRLYAYLGGVIRGIDGTLLAIGGATEHVHLLAELDKNAAFMKSVGVIKAETTRWVHATYPQYPAFAWQPGYGAFTVGLEGLARVKAYIAGQEEHHRQETFLEELRRFLDTHGVAYDPTYL